jgi:hypothetical protein
MSPWVGAAILATLALTLWGYAISPHWLVPLALEGRLPSILGLLVDGGLGASLCRLVAGLTAALLTVAMVELVVRRRAVRIACAAAIAAIAFGHIYWPEPPVGAQVEFAANRDRYAEIARLADAGQLVPEDFYGHTPLPGLLRHTSVLGDAIVRGDIVFIPLWAGILDDAGGLLYSPDRSPEGFDMLGMQCEDPVPFEDGWWSCGMRY